MQRLRVLVIGGYGLFGARLVERLAWQPDLHVLVVGRSAAKAAALVEALRPTAHAELSSTALDTAAPTLTEQIDRLAPAIVVHTAGPFQAQSYQVAMACVACGSHYIDLADGREFVQGIGVLDSAAQAAKLLITSGASSVPALSSAAADWLARDLVRLHRIHIGISPGNRTERGLATVQSILSCCGAALPGDAAHRAFGWSGSQRHHYPAPVGPRLLSPCDVPDLTLLPARYPGTPAVSFAAGLELVFLHRAMNTMALLRRLRLVGDWSVHARGLLRMANWFKSFGSDAGAMHVTVTGSSVDATQVTRTWHLVATHGHGPYVPTLAAVALVRKLQHGDTTLVGARPCVGLLTLQDFQRESAGLNIAMTEASA